MKVLWVKSGGLVPLDTGGKIRSFHILKELARRHPTDLFTFYQQHPEDGHPELERYVHRVFCMPLAIAPANSVGDLAHYARNLFSLQPYSMAKYCRPQVAQRLRQVMLSQEYDVVVCDFFLTGAVIPWDMPQPKVLFTHNVEAQIWQRHYQVSRNPLWRAVAWREYKTIARLERRYLQQADFVLTVSENDREFFARFIGPAKLAAISTGVDVEYFRATPGAEQPNTLVFTGSMDWMPNEDGILHFLDEILPRVRRDIPEVSLWVVGRSPSPRLQKAAGRLPGVKITGRVDDIRPYLQQGAVYVVPLRIGGGTRIKIFEAMAAGKAVVSTTLGAEGLPVTDGQNILLADEPEEFARRVVELLRNEGLRSRMGRAARELVEHNYSWASVTQQFSAVLERVAGASSASSHASHHS